MIFFDTIVVSRVSTVEFLVRRVEGVIVASISRAYVCVQSKVAFEKKVHKCGRVDRRNRGTSMVKQ